MKKTLRRLGGRFAIIAVLTLSAMTAVFTLGPSNQASAANPTTLNFQGKVVNATTFTNVSTTTYPFVFRIYNTPTPTTATACSSDAACLYEETMGSVQVTNGVFQVELGSGCSGGLVASNACTKSVAGGLNFNSNSALYLVLKFNNDAAGFMNNPIHLTSVPYAFYADNAGNLGGIAASGFIQNATSPQSANIDVQAATSGSIGAVIAANASGTGDILDLKNGSNVAVATFGSSGAVLLKNSTNSTGAFQIQNLAGSTLFGVNTSSGNTNNIVANSSFESAISNWSAVGTGTTSQSSAQAYEGNDSLLIASGATEGGASYSTGATTFLSTNTTYTMSALVKTDSSTVIHVDMGDEELTGTLIPCLSNRALPTNGGWQRLTCTWTTSATTPTNSFIYFKQTSTDPAATKNIFVDDVLVQTNANAQNIYNNGSVSFSGSMIASPLILQGINSTNALQVNNAAGTQIFNIDTTDTNLISNPGFEVNSTGWAASGTGSVRRDTTQSYIGVASLKVVSQAAANSGAQFSLNPVVTTNTGTPTYAISFYARYDSASTTPTFSVRYSPDGTATSDCSVTAINSTSVISFGWTRLYCAVSSATAPTTSGFIRIMQTDTATHTYYIDGVQMEQATVSNITPYGGGSISLNAVINSPVTIKNSSDSTTAFNVQNANGLNVLNVDTTIGNVNLGVGSLQVAGLTLAAAPTWSVSTLGGSLATSEILQYLVAAVGPGGEGFDYPTSPASTTAMTGTTSSVTLNWGTTAGATSYKVYRSTDGITWKVITLGVVTTYTDTTDATWSVTGTRHDFSATGNVYLPKGGGIYLSPAGNMGVQYSAAIDAMEFSNFQSGSGIALYSDNFKVVDSVGFGTSLAITNTGATTFRNRTDSAAGFVIQNAGFVPIFTADTNAGNIQIGSSTTNATDNLLVLDSYNNGTDPTGITGAMYYNTSLGQFRCYTTSWGNCAGAGGGGDLQAAYAAASSPATITTTATAKGIIFKAGATFDSATLFQIQNAAGLSILSANSTGTTSVSLATNDSGSIAWGNIGSTVGLVRTDDASATYNGKIYYYGGTVAGVKDNSMDVYDTASNTWSTISSYGAGITPTARINASAVAWEGKIYVFGGASSVGVIDTLDIYTIATNSWSSGLADPAASGVGRQDHSAVVYNGKMYVYGGRNPTNTILNTLDIYDTVANTWGTGANTTVARTQHASVVYNGKIYNFLGRNGSGTMINTIDVFDISAGTWGTGTSGGTLRANLDGAVYNGKAYLYAGNPTTGPELNTLETYDFSTGTWGTARSGGTARFSENVSVVNTKLYAFGGYNSAIVGINALDIYDLVNGTWNGVNNVGGLARYENTTAVYNGKVYYWGGTINGSTVSTMDIYDPSNNTWTASAGGGTARNLATAVVSDSKMIIWGGLNSGGTAINTVDIYDFSTNTWTTGSGTNGTGSTARAAYSAALYKGKIYYWGGSTTASATAAGGVNTMQIYDIAGNTWTAGSGTAGTGSTARSGQSAVAYNGKMYNWGGVDTSGNVLTSVNIYDFAGNTWTLGTPGGTGRSAFGSVLYNGKMYNWGGVTTGSVYLNTVDIYDIANNSWGTGPAGNMLRENVSAAVVNDTMYAWGGDNGATFGFNNLEFLNLGTEQAGILVLGNGNSDPTGQDGGIYYNTDTNTLRCYSGATGWQNCNSNVGWSNGATGSHFVQAASGVNLLNADSTNSVVNVGSTISDSTQILFTLDSYNTFADTAACGLVNVGAMYYNSSAGALGLRACNTITNGATAWTDIVTADDLGMVLFGIIPDGYTGGGSNSDLTGNSTTDATRGPCKVYMGSVANSIRWTGCTMYTHGRKQIVAPQTTDYTTGITTTGAAFQNLCMFTSGAAPTFGTASVTEAVASVPLMFTSAPDVCLATIKEIAGGSGIGAIYDTRFFTTSTKVPVTISSSTALGVTVKLNGTIGQAVITTATTDPFFGVLVAWSGTGVTNAPNGIAVTSGPVYVKATAGSIGAYVRPTATAGHVNTTALVTAVQSDIPYNYLGLAETSFNAPGTQCSVVANADTCRGSILVNVNIR